MKKCIHIIVLFFLFFQVYAQENNQGYHLINLDINTKGSDYGAILLNDSLVVFTSEQKNSGRRLKKSVNRIPFTDIYIADRADSQVVNPRVIDASFMSSFNESDATFSQDGKLAFFTSNNLVGKRRARQDEQGAVNLQILMVRQDKNCKWGQAIPLDFTREQYSYAHPSISADGKKLFFSSNMPGSVGKSDIFYINLFEDGDYSAPINAGYNINTPDIENYPFEDNNGTLYFSSNRHGGQGGLDIYYAHLDDNGFFDVPRLMSSPINSQADDFAFKFYEENYLGFLSSNREGGKGSDDIYMFYQSCDVLLSGIVQEAVLLDTLYEAHVYLYNADSVLLDSAWVDSINPSYQFAVDCEKEYLLLPRKNLFSGIQSDVSTIGLRNTVVEANLSMSPIINEKMVIMIGPIYFDFDEAEIRPTIDGKDEMDHIVRLMTENPSMVVEVASYTDSRGDTLYNEKLSQARADSTVAYIIKAGIDSTRNYGKGYGEKNLVNNCSDGVDCKPEEHQKNRRTEFKVVSMEGEDFEQIIRTNEAYKKEDEELDGN